MQIWVDADACPGVVMEILFRAAIRTEVSVTMVANKSIKVPKSPYLRTIQVAQGLDAADTRIVEQLSAGDLVITADIPLADEIIGKGGYVLTPRGERYTAENVKSRLNMRDFMETLRASGIHTGGPQAYNLIDRKAFADELDRWLAKHL